MKIPKIGMILGVSGYKSSIAALQYYDFVFDSNAFVFVSGGNPACLEHCSRLNSQGGISLSLNLKLGD